MIVVRFDVDSDAVIEPLVEALKCEMDIDERVAEMVADRYSAEDLANMLDVSDVADCIYLGDLADKFDLDDVAEAVAMNIDTSDVYANVEINYSELADMLAETSGFASEIAACMEPKILKDMRERIAMLENNVIEMRYPFWKRWWF
ncbi:MAG: hypothetical protein EBU52_12715 [Cytophagia bacterium]|nr:hypothetical protein [Cytophagia bacterium]